MKEVGAAELGDGNSKEVEVQIWSTSPELLMEPRQETLLWECQSPFSQAPSFSVLWGDHRPFSKPNKYTYNVCEILQVVVGILDHKLGILLQLLCFFLYCFIS